mmetsp:Transcript_7205/g.9655  ORF Transcript_7205/g.9655 Transcript_7205/m.9655 type:complete len:89 (+) Transcript_7205:161-427(+)
MWHYHHTQEQVLRPYEVELGTLVEVMPPHPQVTAHNTCGEMSLINLWALMDAIPKDLEDAVENHCNSKVERLTVKFEEWQNETGMCSI